MIEAGQADGTCWANHGVAGAHGDAHQRVVLGDDAPMDRSVEAMVQWPGRRSVLFNRAGTMEGRYPVTGVVLDFLVLVIFLS